MISLVAKDRLSQQVANFAAESNKARGQSKDEIEATIAKREQEFGTDEPILGFAEINETLDDAEDRHTGLIVGSVWSGVDQWLSKISPALNRLDETEINKTPLNLAPQLQGILMNAWRDIFSTGSRAGVAEINELNINSTESKNSPKGLFNVSNSATIGFNFASRRDDSPDVNRTHSFSDFVFDSNTSNFDNRDLSGVDKYIKRKAAFEVAYPPDQADLDVLEIDELRAALNERTQVLADDLSQSINDRIERIIKDSVDVHYVQGKEVQRLPKAARNKILKQINGVISRERQVQKAAGVPEEELARLEIPVPGTDAFVKRARMIASTELNAGYNLGRLQTYARAGVKSVRWQAISDRRTCKYCLSRNGDVLPLSTVLAMGRDYARASTKKAKYNNFEYVIPAHPFCRCAWQVASKKEAKDPRRIAGAAGFPVALPAGWLKLGAAAGLVSKVGVAGTVLVGAERATREKQLQEKAKRRARNRAAIAVGGALSLGALSIAMWSWINKPKPEAASPEQVASSDRAETGVKKVITKAQEVSQALGSETVQDRAVASALVKSQGQLLLARQRREIGLANSILTPEQLMRGRNVTEVGWNQSKQAKYQNFLTSGVDLKNITDSELRSRFGMLPQDIAAVRGLQRKHVKQLTQLSPYQKLLPAAVFSPLTISKYPWLADIEDVRTLSLKQMLRRGMPESAAIKIYDGIYKQTRSSAGIARVSQAERKVLRRINQIETKEELAGLLQLTRNETKIVNSLFAKIMRLKQQGKEITSTSQLRLRGIGDKTIAGMLEAAEGELRINEIIISSDRSLAEERLQTIAGVGPKTAAVIYDALLDTGTQFLDADDMIRRISPYMKLRGLELNPRVKKALSNRIDFNYYPGLDRQTLTGSNDTFPGLPTGERRGDTPNPVPVLPGGTETIEVEAKEASTRRPVDRQAKSQANPQGNKALITPVTQGVLVDNLDSQAIPEVPQAKLQAQRRRNQKQTQSNIDLALLELTGLGDNLEQVYDSELRRYRPRRRSRLTVAEELTKTEARVAKLTQTNIDGIRETQRQQAGNLIANLDESIADIEASISAGIEDPLVPSNYKENGRLDWSTRNRINTSIRKIDVQINRLNASRDLSSREKTELKKLVKQLEKLKKQTLSASTTITNNPTSSTSFERQKVINRARELAQELENLPVDSVSRDYPVQDRLNDAQRLEKKAQTSASFNPAVVEEIDSLLAQLNSIPERIQNNSDPKLVRANEKLASRLTKRRNKLMGIRDSGLTGVEANLNRQTIAQRKLIDRQNRTFVRELNQFEKDFLELESNLPLYEEKLISQTQMTSTDVLANNRSLLVGRAGKQIARHTEQIALRQREIDLLKSKRWQEYATSLAILEDSGKEGSLGNNYLSFDELVERRNQSLNQAAATIKQSAQQMKSWADNPNQVLLIQLRALEELEVEGNVLTNKQQKLRTKAEDLINLATANPKVDASSLVTRIRQKATAFEQQVNANQEAIAQAKANIIASTEEVYRLDPDPEKPEVKPRSVTKIKEIADRYVERAEKRLVRKDYGRVTQVFNTVDQAGLNIGEFIEATRSGNYSPVQQAVVDSLSPQGRKSLNLALSKGLLELNQDSRVLRSSSVFLDSVLEQLRQRRKSAITDTLNTIPIKGNRRAKLVERLQIALAKGNIIEAQNIIEELPKSLATQIGEKIVLVSEIIGDKKNLSQLEVNILAGVRPDKMERDNFINQTKAAILLGEEGRYTLVEIKKAISLNRIAQNRVNNRLSAMNFTQSDQLIKLTSHV